MPNSKAIDRHWEQNRELLAEAARNAGVDPGILVKIAGFESGFDTHARPISRSHPERNVIRQFDGTMALSSAYGLGQFTKDTWLDVIHRHGEKYGVANAARMTEEQANAPALRNDPRLQAAMLAEFTRENIARGRALGGSDPDANVYALHNLGSGDGPKFLEALRNNPRAPVTAVLSAKVIRGNPALYGDGNRTLEDAYRVMGAKMDDYASYAAALGARPTRQESVPPPVRHAAPAASDMQNRAAIYNEARLHFIDGRERFEYGRGDTGRRPNEGGDGRTDQSRNERDLDGDGRKGVDCSSFVWRGLRNAGYDVPAAAFTTRDLFNGRDVTPYARRHFDVVAADQARRPNGSLQRGDILMFKDKSGTGQHVGIFQGYDANGHIQFIGSQVSSGPALVTVRPGAYWDGHNQVIVGALRAKPEFHVRAPLHAQASATAGREHAATVQAERPAASVPRPAVPPADADGVLRHGEKGPAVSTLQQRLAELGYRGEDGKPLRIDGDFGDNTRFAVQAFQREHGLEGLGVAGPKTATALAGAERALLSHPSHPQHALYAQVLERVQAEERAKGIAPGPHSARIAGALAVECLREGITRVDRVELNRDITLVRGVQVSALRDEPGLNITTDAISTRQAAAQPMLESTEQLQQVAANREARQLDAQQRQAAATPVLAQ